MKDKEEKFFFNVNIFDEQLVEEPEEEEVPLPPVFSESEVEAARARGFVEGKKAGLEEAEAGHTALLEKISRKIMQDTSVLFQQESERDRLFEQEAVALTLALFGKLFPLYRAEHGFSELRECIRQILQKQQGQREIAVTVSPENAGAIRTFLSRVSAENSSLRFFISTSESVPPDGCTLSWSEGGAVRNPDELARQITEALQQMLAGPDAKSHDETLEIRESSDE